MASIAVLRQIVTDIHSFAPQGLRKAMRSELAAKICKPNTLVQNKISFFELSSNFYMHIDANGTSDFNMSRWHRPSLSSDYFAKVYCKEQNLAIKKTLKDIGVHLRNKTGEKIAPERKFNILQGLMVSKKAGMELPKTVILENLTDELGYFLQSRPKIITIDPNRDKLCKTAIHETAHKNDAAANIVSKLPIVNALSLITDKLIPLFNKNLITKEVRNYAVTDRDEFIACTVEKLLSEQKSWSDLDPKIKKLYNLFLGPKIKTNEL
jgi:hypothetical protein